MWVKSKRQLFSEDSFQKEEQQAKKTIKDGILELNVRVEEFIKKIDNYNDIYFTPEAVNEFLAEMGKIVLICNQITNNILNVLSQCFEDKNNFSLIEKLNLYHKTSQNYLKDLGIINNNLNQLFEKAKEIKCLPESKKSKVKIGKQEAFLVEAKTICTNIIDTIDLLDFYIRKLSEKFEDKNEVMVIKFQLDELCKNFNVTNTPKVTDIWKLSLVSALSHVVTDHCENIGFALQQ